MDAQEILNALNLGEGKDWEFKGAKGGLPGNLWETYSAMANTDGGVIVLGIKEQGGKFYVEDLTDPARMKQDFWNLANNRQKINLNLLSNHDVTIETMEAKSVIAIRIPRATRRQRPVYVGQNPLEGTYRRYQEGDYKCTQDEVGRMLADQADEPADSLILEHFNLSDLDPVSLQQYRQRFSSRDPEHPWLSVDDRGFLEKLGGWRRDRQTDKEGLTVAGLLMFGKDEAIRDSLALPQYWLDYRERLSDDSAVRWTDRVTIDGTWVANLFYFYQRVIMKLFADLKTPFQMGADLFRRDETIVHEAIREALVNALIHADYRGMGGIVIEKYRDRIEMSNPGSLLLAIEQVLKGGVSECRNKSLQKMFLMIGGGEQAGSGMDKIRKGWASQQWRLPGIEETTRPDRVRVVLPMVSLLPEESLERLQVRFGNKLKKLDPLEVQALVTADVEGGVSNSRMQQICDKHPFDLTRLLQRLVNKGMLTQDGQKRGATYRLPGPSTIRSSQSVKNSSHKGDSSHKGEKDSSHISGIASEEELEALVRIAVPAVSNRRLPPEETRRIILRLCENPYLTAVEIGELMDRNPMGLRSRFLTPMVEEGLLLRKYPYEPNRPDQAYKTKK